ncbi:hypothetical protein [Photobacterium chitinilyticum]|uniref:GNAT family N-acetyltransferase n=1 Tax=Photobacterium chitinilyticum TaxID=2485123 RepID=A0A3S3QS59_9GAMM|nr:hypothetical protein [Photobacterium chitinilyticum]RWX54981.1 hypothetical protein EDI28_14685 [Photobacterium chitinilyticum]
MYFRLVRPTAADFAAHLNLLKPAFVGSDDPKGEFEFVRTLLEEGRGSFYLLAGKGIKLWFVSRVIDSRYHIIAMTGRGLVQAASHIIERVSQCGYHAISYHTYRKGMRRILSRFGFDQTEQLREFDGKAETVHQLELIRGAHG